METNKLIEEETQDITDRSIVEHHKFDQQMEELKALTKITVRNCKPLQEKGWFLDKNVTAEQFNNFMEVVNDNLIELRDSDSRNKKGLIGVYETFETLDKDYIAGIQGSVNRISKEAKKSIKLAGEVKNTQEDLIKTVDGLLSVKEDFTKFKSSVNKKISALNKKLNDYKPETENVQNEQNEQSEQCAPKDRLSKKIIIAYVLAAASLAVAVTHIILDIYGVM